MATTSPPPKRATHHICITTTTDTASLETKPINTQAIGREPIIRKATIERAIVRKTIVMATVGKTTAVVAIARKAIVAMVTVRKAIVTISGNRMIMSNTETVPTTNGLASIDRIAGNLAIIRSKRPMSLVARTMPLVPILVIKMILILFPICQSPSLTAIWLV